MKLVIATVLGSVLFTSCASTPRTKSTSTDRSPALDSVLTLEKVEPFFKSSSSYGREEIQRLLGQPDIKKKMKSEHWVYVGDGTKMEPRLSMIFEPGTGSLQSVTWQVRKGDPDSLLMSLWNHYPKAQFEVLPPQWIDAHTVSTERALLDRTMGLQITYASATKQVDTIEWNRPE